MNILNTQEIEQCAGGVFATPLLTAVGLSLGVGFAVDQYHQNTRWIETSEESVAKFQNSINTLVAFTAMGVVIGTDIDYHFSL